MLYITSTLTVLNCIVLKWILSLSLSDKNYPVLTLNVMFSLHLVQLVGHLDVEIRVWQVLLSEALELHQTRKVWRVSEVLWVAVQPNLEC